MPYIVRQCIEEVEKRGIEEVGIYRISGVATDIQALKAVFDASECPGRRLPFASRYPGRVHRHRDAPGPLPCKPRVWLLRCVCAKYAGAPRKGLGERRRV